MEKKERKPDDEWVPLGERRGAPLPKVNRKRRRKAFTAAFGSGARVEWVHRQACFVFRYGSLPDDIEATDDFDCEGPIEAMHPHGRKNDWTVPCCRKHHREAHSGGHTSFATKYNLSLAMAAALYDALWRLTTEEQELT